MGRSPHTPLQCSTRSISCPSTDAPCIALCPARDSADLLARICFKNGRPNVRFYGPSMFRCAYANNIYGPSICVSREKEIAHTDTQRPRTARGARKSRALCEPNHDLRRSLRSPGALDRLRHRPCLCDIRLALEHATHRLAQVAHVLLDYRCAVLLRAGHRDAQAQALRLAAVYGLVAKPGDNDQRDAVRHALCERVLAAVRHKHAHRA
mmetsp:Transcript_25739/g.76614  ORF Transcript_25739/g.76614 Transcript_25739/m.76614 type:complete len:209 (+) Transcript_25739:507-1133(+)